MRVARILIMCSTSLLVSQICAAQQPPATQPPQSANPAAQSKSEPTPSSTTSVIPSYPDTPKGLQDLMNEMLKLKKKHDAKALAPYLDSLALPNAAAWFRATFGDEMGQQLADSYDHTKMDMPLGFPDILDQLNSKHFAHAKAILFTDSCSPDASADEYQTLASRENAQPLYDVRLGSSSQTATVSYFAYVDGAFRYLSNFHINPPANASRTKADVFKTPGAVPVKAEITRGRVIKQVTPIYPAQARAEHIQGLVVLHAIIGKNGLVCNLLVMDGNPLLSASAMAAVRQWQYKPYMINGQPVYVDTTITVTFQLGN